MAKLTGTLPGQVPTNADLASMAFQDTAAVNIGGGNVSVFNNTANNYFSDTNVSTVNPSLILDFANSKVLDPRITFTRSSTATYYDGKTQTLAEQNLYLNSANMSNTVVNAGLPVTTTYSTTTFNTAVAPDGTMTAAMMLAASGNTVVTYVLYNANNPTTSGLTYTTSVYVKAGSTSTIQIGASGVLSWANFDLSTGTIGANSGSSPTIQSVGNGWYRCAITYVANGIGTILKLEIQPNTSVGRDNTWSPTGNEFIYFWGAQLEQRANVTAYTPTGVTAITNYIPVLQTAANNVARFDHDPITGECKGFLIEESRTNMLTYSADITSGDYQRIEGTVASNIGIAPDGTMTADLFVESTTPNIGHRLSRTSISITSGTVYTASVYVKSAGRNQVAIDNHNGSSDIVTTYDLSLGTVLNGTGSIQAVGNGWYRIAQTFTAAATVTNNYAFSVYLCMGILNVYSGNGYSGIYIWGEQLEVGSFATSYIPTTSAQVTRIADITNITGTNFSQWYRQDQGTFLLSGDSNNSATSATYMYLIANDGTVSNAVQITGSGREVVNSVSKDGSTSFTVYTGFKSTYPFTFVNSFGYNSKDYASYNKGTLIGVGTTGDTPTNLTRMDIGSRYNGTYHAGQINIKSIKYYPKRLSDAELQELTL